MSKMFMNVKEVMEVLEVSEAYAYKLMKRLNRELQAMGCLLYTSPFQTSAWYHAEIFGATAGIQ